MNSTELEGVFKPSNSCITNKMYKTKVRCDAISWRKADCGRREMTTGVLLQIQTHVKSRYLNFEPVVRGVMLPLCKFSMSTSLTELQFTRSFLSRLADPNICTSLTDPAYYKSNDFSSRQGRESRDLFEALKCRSWDCTGF